MAALLRLLPACLALLVAPLHAGAQAEADPPGRVGRVADLDGTVWWFDLEQGRWSDAVRNRPLTAGDRLATGRDGRVELRIGSTTVTLDDGGEVEFLRLDDERVRIQLHRGRMAVRLRSRELAAETEFGTDEGWLQPQRGGLYRLDREEDTSFAAAWRGEMRLDGVPGLEIGAGRRLQFWREGPQRALRHRWIEPLDDAFAARVLRDDGDDARSASAAHVSPEMTGWEELDRHGEWDRHPEYGVVWLPHAVAADWAPYRRGRWAWIRPWGWTWIDDARWGFAPFHYGRWLNWRGRWCWVPGGYVARPVFAPALVGWIDGPAAGVGLRAGGPDLSWVALAPWETFRPHYRVSPGYRDRVNPPDHRRVRPPPRHPGGDAVYGNQGVPDAVTVVPVDALRHPRPGADAGGPRSGADRRPPPPPPTAQPLPTRPARTPRESTPTAPGPRLAEPLPQRQQTPALPTQPRAPDAAKPRPGPREPEKEADKDGERRRDRPPQRRESVR